MLALVFPFPFSLLFLFFTHLSGKAKAKKKSNAFSPIHPCLPLHFMPLLSSWAWACCCCCVCLPFVLFHLCCHSRCSLSLPVCLVHISAPLHLFHLSLLISLLCSDLNSLDHIIGLMSWPPWGTSLFSRKSRSPSKSFFLSSRSLFFSELSWTKSFRVYIFQSLQLASSALFLFSNVSCSQFLESGYPFSFLLSYS